MGEFVKADKTICITTNSQGKIHYSNIDKDAAGKCLEDIRIFDHLPVDGAFNYKVGDYNITADKVVLGEGICYLILIQPQGNLYNLYKYAYRDSFTGLYNRNYWEHLVSGMLHRSIPKKFTLIVIDIDNLKSINDSRGHLAGDRAIWIVGKSIRESIRREDIAIRYGGDEFFILLANARKDVAEKVIKKIKENIRKRGEKENIHTEISAGIACSDCAHEIGKMIAIADSRMYKEKAWKKVRAKHVTVCQPRLMVFG